MNWPLDSEAMRRKRRTAYDLGCGILIGMLICVILVAIVRSF